MKKVLLLIISLLLFGFLFIIVSVKNNNQPTKKPSSQILNKQNLTMKITSSAFENNQRIPSVYTCNGKGINPSLTFSDIPVDTKSLALIIEDPDAPGGMFVHWIVYNINKDVKTVGEGDIPHGGIEGLSSTGKPGYVPPCPPIGTHRYYFKLYALDIVNLNLPGTPGRDMVLSAMEGHIIEESNLIGLYSLEKELPKIR